MRHANSVEELADCRVRELKTKSVYAPGEAFLVKGTLAGGATGSITGEVSQGILENEKGEISLLNPDELQKEIDLQAAADAKAAKTPAE